MADTEIESVQVSVSDLRTLHAIALRCPYRFIDDLGKPDDLLEVTDAVGEVLPCAACEPGVACADCTDGAGHAWGPSDA